MRQLDVEVEVDGCPIEAEIGYGVDGVVGDVMRVVEERIGS